MVNVESKERNIEILISTMNRTSLGFLSKIFSGIDYSNHDILIINQTSKELLLTSPFKNIRVINSFEKGLSKSRNLAIKNAVGDICLFADDDIVYEAGFDKKILRAFEKHQDADIITFKMVNDNGELYNKYPNVIIHNSKTLNTVNSVVIAIKREKIIKKAIFFNDHFGLGSTFETADEYIFLRSALKKRLKIVFEPEILLRHPNFSSGKAVTSDRIVYARSAVFYKYNGIITYFKLGWHLFLLIRSNKLKFKLLIKKYLMGLKGINKYKMLLKQGLEVRKS